MLDGNCKSQNTEKSIKCDYCNRKFKADNALKQHIKAKHEKGFTCSYCGKDFKTEQSLSQHVKAKHEKKNNDTNKNNQIKKNSKSKPELEVYERLSLLEKLRMLSKRISNNKKTVILDECVGNDESVINILKYRYQVKPIPNNLLSHEDMDLRLAIKEKKWGLVTKDFEMALKSRKAKIKPVYFFKEVRGNRALIKISKRNFEVN